jgi:2-polyprenyl-6-methoxyphenol hydroxylase-like FAD-dependent oxidoreductase
MKIVCIGGGPAGLYFALLMKLQDPAHDIVVVERNRPYDTFGWGVVFSDQTLGNLRAADPVTAARRSSTPSATGTTSRSTSAATRCGPAATASAASGASGC